MVNVNLESIREYFPKLKRFIARLRENEIDLLSEKNKVDVDANEVYECFSNCWVIIAFSETLKRFDIDIPIEYVIAAVKWLDVQDKADTDILLNKLNMIDDLDYMDNAIYQLYKVLSDTLEREYKMEELLKTIAEERKKNNDAK